jgi:hypothetical protein
MRKTLTLAFSVALLGCQAAPVFWDKPGVTQEQFNIESAQCDNQAFSLVNVPMIQRNIVNQSCMRSKGYTMVDNK